MAPVVIAAIAIAGAGVSAYGAIKQGQAAQAAADYNAKVSKQNADIALQQADVQAEQQRRQAKLQLGQMRANYGASGLQLEGSPMEVLEDSARQAELDNLTIKYNGKLKAMGFNNDATLSQFEGENAKSNSYFQAGGTLLSGAANAASTGLKLSG